MKSGARAEIDDVDAVLPVGNTGNTVPTLTLKITKKLKAQLVAAAKARRVSVSELVRQAIETSLREQPKPTGYELIRDLIEGLPLDPDGPTDLSTNPKYMEGYGLDNAQYRKKYGRDRRYR